MKSLSRNGSLITLLGITSAAMLGGFAGCSSSGDDSAVNNPDGSTTGDDGSAGGDGSPQGDGGTGGDSGGPTTISTGSVTFTQGNTLTPGTFSNSASAAFYVLPAGTDLDCLGYGTAAAPAAAGATCSIKICTNPIATDGGVSPTDAGATTSPNTGNITLLSAADTGGVVITANADGTYTPATAVTKWWDGADNTIEVKSAGSATSIAAFDNTALIGPGDISAVKFNSTDITGVVATAPAFDRGTNLAVTYSGGTTGTKVNVRLTTTSSTQKSMITCNFDASNGAESIATADLEQLQQAGSTGVTGMYAVQGQNVKATTAGAFNFNVTLGATLRSGSFTNTN